ncbi:MAG: peptidoglycan recognition family protein [Myxococcaceae bacterium]
MNQPLLKAAVLFLCFAGCSGEAQLTLEQDSEPTVDATSSTSSELASARPLLNMGLGIVPREAWGAWAPGSCRPGQSPNRIVVHHVGGDVSDSYGWLQSYQRELRVNRGWCDLMYHFGVDEQGRIFEMVATGVQGAHATNANLRTVGIVLMGDYTDRLPSAAQIASLQKLFVALNQVYGISIDRSSIVGHRQVMQTACPGNLAYPHLDEWVAGAITPPPPPQGASAVPFTPPTFTATTTPLRLSQISSRRLIDTRNTGALQAGQLARAFGSQDVPGASAVSLGVAVVSPSADTFVSIAGGDARAPTSTVNARAGTVRANQTFASLQTGAVSMFSPQTTNVVIDEQARFAPSGKGFFPLGPSRLLDTRTTSPLAAGETRAISLAPLGVPASAVAVQVGLAAVPRGTAGFVSLIPCGTSPTVSALNFDGTQVASSAALAPVSGGQLCVFSNVATDLVLDVAGWFDDGGASLTLAAPVRLLDTRDGQGGWQGVPTADQVLTLDLAAMPGFSGSTAIAFNLTGADALGAGFAQVWDCTGTPSHSNQNATPGTAVATLGVVRSTGKLCVRTTSPQHLIIDLVGVFR